MEMEMVMIDALVMARPEERKDAVVPDAVQLSTEVRMAMEMVKPSSLLAEAAIAMSLSRSRPQQMEVEMAEAIMATVDPRELEMMMVMLKPLDACQKRRGKWCRRDMAALDMETEMVLQQQTDL